MSFDSAIAFKSKPSIPKKFDFYLVEAKQILEIVGAYESLTSAINGATAYVLFSSSDNAFKKWLMTYKLKGHKTEFIHDEKALQRLISFAIKMRELDDSDIADELVKHYEQSNNYTDKIEKLKNQIEDLKAKRQDHYKRYFEISGEYNDIFNQIVRDHFEIKK